jgi:glutathione synthase/RimK-type ligase-like ATP-grasp enzyme
LPTSVHGPGSTLHDLHFSANVPAQLAASMSGEFHFQSVIAELPAASLPPSLPKADVVLNNCVNAEQMNVPRRAERVLDVVARAGLPVINHPRAVIATTRQKVAALIDGIPNLRVPRVERYRRDLGPPSVIAADIEDRFAYPVILRTCQSHSSAKLQHSATSSVAVLARDGLALRDSLETLGWPEFYAIEYVSLHRPDGQFRKIRAVLTEDEVIIAIPAFASEWMVGGGRGRANGIAYYRAHPELTAECRRIVLDPEGELGRDCLRTLEAVRDRLPLDFCGIDFELDDEGRVVFFEANAAMNLLKRRSEPADITLPDEPFERIKAAFRRTVERRIAGVA